MATASVEPLFSAEDAEVRVDHELREESDQVLEERAQRMQKALKTFCFPDGGKKCQRTLLAIRGELARREAALSASPQPRPPRPQGRQGEPDDIRCERIIQSMCAELSDVVVASPDIVGKENTSSGHVADSSISKLCEGSRSIGKNKRHSSDVVCKFSKRLAFGLHETSETETVAKQCSTPFSEAGPMFSIACNTLTHPLQRLNDTQQKEGARKLMNTPKNLHVQLKQELSKLIKVLQLPDNVRFIAAQLFEYVLNNHQVVTEPVGILHAFNIALCWRAASLLNCKVDCRESLALAEKSLNCKCNEDLVALMYRKLRILKEKIPYRAGETSIKGQPVSVEDIQPSWQETSTNLERHHMLQNKEMYLHGKFTNGASHEISNVAEQIISERQEPVQETRRECHVQNDEIPSMIVEKSIDLVGNVFSIREKNILCKQQLEISGLVTHRQNNVIRLKEVGSLVLEHIRRSHIDEMTRREKIKLTAQWFNMLMCAFLEHMKLQHEKLEGLQSDTWSSERQLKENFHQVAKSGQLDQDFDQSIALPDSNFVMEEFIHFKEQNDEYHIVESSLSHCQQSSNAALLMEITSNPAAQQSNLGTEVASDLQPEVQPSTTMQDEPEEGEDEPEAVDEPAETERAATLGDIAALCSLKCNHQTTQDVPLERAYLSGMSVLHSPTIHQSVEPSLDPHAGAEPVGMVTAHDLEWFSARYGTWC